MQPWALVTPASRGIGFALTRRILLTTNVPVIATARKDLDQIKENLLEGLNDVDESRLTVLKLDVLGGRLLVLAAH
jgi:NAD(P)-dependent dehydrogenase (short-subunit alcohol dehydrogenase family)